MTYIFSTAFKVLSRRAYWSHSPKLIKFSRVAQEFPPYIFSEVEQALEEGKPVVALESTLIVAKDLENIVREKGVTPATIALYEGNICVGLDDKQLESIAQPRNQPVKASRRDIPNVLAERKIGGTTVAATMWIAHHVGIKIFSTGGIGGVHKGAEQTFDVSADLVELGRTPMAVVCAGAKSILDIPKTLEVLETHGVNCIVYDDQNLFPGFFTRRTPWKGAHNTNSLENISNILACTEKLGLQNGALIACPVPEEFAQESEMVEKAVEIALEDAKVRIPELFLPTEEPENKEEFQKLSPTDCSPLVLFRKANISNKETTPFLLKRVNELTGSASLRINIALLENNARVAAELANIYYFSSKSIGQTYKRSEPSKKPSTVVAPRIIRSGRNKQDGNKPKVLVVGASICDFETVTRVEHALRVEGVYHPGQIHQRAGGVARNHADAFTRLDCEANLISIIGKDRFADFLRENCSPNMDWKHAFISTKTTATSMTLNVGGNVMCGFLDIDEIMAQLSPEMISSKQHLFETADFVLLDANLRDDSIACVFHLAQQFGKKVWFEPTNFSKVHKLFGKDALWKKLNAISPNANEFRVMCDHLDIQLPVSVLCNAQFLAEYLGQSPDIVGKMFSATLEHLLITIDKTGCVLLIKKEDGLNNIKFIRPPAISKEEVVSVSGAGLLHNYGIEKSVEVAIDSAKKSLKSIDAVPDSLCLPV